MQPCYIATETFGPRNGESWSSFVQWSGLVQLAELVSLDSMLCPSVLPEIRDGDRPHLCGDGAVPGLFVDLDFLLARIADVAERNLLCVFQDPPAPPEPPAGPMRFTLLGYDLVDIEGEASALTNCGGFPDVFDGAELSQYGLLESHARALEVRRDLRGLRDGGPHADCHVWAICRALGP